jgi:hypothetical protein
MPDKPNKDNLQQKDEMDEIDKFLATLPALDISADMLDDESRIRTPAPSSKTPLTSVLVLLSWLFFLVALLVAALSLPARGNAFYAIFGTSPYVEWHTQYLFYAKWFLGATVFLSTVGLVVCLIKKYKMTKGAALNFIIAGGLSAALIIVFLILA